METFKQRYEEEKIWHKRILIIDIFHCLMEEKHKDWTMQKTANSLGVSIGTVSESIKIAEAIRNGQKFDSRAHALRTIRSKK